MVNKLSRKLHLAKRLLAMAMIIALSLTSVSFAESAEQPSAEIFTAEDMAIFQNIVSTYSINDGIKGYTDYVAEYTAADAARPVEPVVLAADSYTRYEANVDDVMVTTPDLYVTGEDGVPVKLAEPEEAEAVEAENAETEAAETETAEAETESTEAEAEISVLTDEESLIEWKFTVPETGLYNMTIRYYPVAGKNSEIQRAIFIDGELPYREMALVEFYRVWNSGSFERYEDENGVELTMWDRDNQGERGNDLKPTATEIPEWVDGAVYDANGYISEKLSVYLTAGEEHSLTLLSMREPMLINSITFSNDEAIRPYAEVMAQGGQDTSGKVVRIEAENASKTSSQMLYPVQDQSSASVYPASTRYLLNNAIGGNSWKGAGQWIEWEFEVPEDGYYVISLHDQQNFVRGVKVYRKIYVDGVVPFEEFNAYGFAYRQSWRMETLADENGDPYRIYLTAGEKHTIRMEVVLGEMGDIIARVQDCVQQLNDIYRQVIYITGVAPDQYRDYQIEASLPDLEGKLIAVQEDLRAALARLNEVTNGEKNSDKLTVLRTMDDQLDELIEDQERFTEVLSSFKTNVRACGNWITQVLGQPLQLDTIYIHSADVEVEAEGSDWWSGLVHEAKRLYYSFIIDYNQVGNVAEVGGEDVVLTLWIGTGRDQANVIKSLIDNDFSEKNPHIKVNVQLVDMNTLLRATLSGQGPDVAIQVANTNGIAGGVLNTGNDTPVNYGLRQAVMDLARFPDFAQVAERFNEEALVPFSFNGACYALPDTMTFPMLFYRKDILAEIGLEVETDFNTWDDVRDSMSILAKNQMEFGMLPSEQIFAMLLFQNGGQYYTEGGKASALDQDIAINVFSKYCEYYTDYKLDRATSAEERFRTGEAPVIISDYTTYNNLQVSAPDILGLWDFTVVPGTPVVDENGQPVLDENGEQEINRATGASGLADIIMSATEHPNESWEFLKWWTSKDTQVKYGREMEALMGASARVATANKEALASLSWPMKDYKALMEQMAHVQGIPQVPGGYYTWRNVNNAFYTVTTNTATNGITPREALMDKVYYINAEIEYKRKEFDLPLAGDPVVENNNEEGGAR